MQLNRASIVVSKELSLNSSPFTASHQKERSLKYLTIRRSLCSVYSCIYFQMFTLTTEKRPFSVTVEHHSANVSSGVACKEIVRRKFRPTLDAIFSEKERTNERTYPWSF